LRLWLLFCSDLALRSGTANKLNGSNYDPERGELRFMTKGGACQMLPITTEIATLIASLDHHSPIPYVWQLRKKEQLRGHPSLIYRVRILRAELKALRLSLGITKRIIPHDLRRTAAVAMLNETHDIRTVKVLLGHSDLKTTLGYLDHDIIHLDQSMLEAIKRPFLVKPKEKTA
jgi:integrase